MKILLTTDNIGGVWTFSINLARNLVSSGNEVILAIIGEAPSLNQIREAGFTEYHHFRSRQEWMHDPWHDISNAGEWLMKLKDKINPDIVHLNSYSFGSLPWNCPVIMTAHSCILSWWAAIKKENLPSELSVYRDNVQKGIQSAEVLVAPSMSMLKSVIEHYGPVKRTMVIYNGSDSSLFSSGRKENIIFSMGRLWDEAKNIKLILKAAPDIVYPIYIVGDISGLDVSRVPSNVHFLGRLNREQIAGWLSKTTIYLLPVKYEPFGYSFLEAAFSGCAIVTGAIESMREIWNDTVAYADPLDADALSSIVSRLMTDEKQRNTLSDSSMKLALSEYTAERMASEYNSLYSSVTRQQLKKDLKLQEK